MKKTFLTLLAFSFALQSFAQDTDFFAGKWEITFFGTPQGDIKMKADLKLEGDKLEGILTTDADEIDITKIEENSNDITLYFTAQGYDVNVKLTKTDEDHLSGSLMDMFDAKAQRIKETDFFAGKWQITVKDTPQGDAVLETNLVRNGQNLSGVLMVKGDKAMEIAITNIEEEEESIKLYFTAQSYDVWILLKKVSEDMLKGTSLDMFEATALRLK